MDHKLDIKKLDIMDRLEYKNALKAVRKRLEEKMDSIINDSNEEIVDVDKSKNPL